jgi:hypothetical protein
MRVALVALVVCATAAAGATGATSATAGDQRLVIIQPAGSNAAEARIGTIVALAKKACPDQVGQCEEDNECAREIDSLIRGAQPISAAAQALVQCVSSNTAQIRLQLRSEQSVKQAAFGRALKKKAGACWPRCGPNCSLAGEACRDVQGRAGTP